MSRCINFSPGPTPSLTAANLPWGGGGHIEGHEGIALLRIGRLLAVRYTNQLPSPRRSSVHPASVPDSKSSTTIVDRAVLVAATSGNRAEMKSASLDAAGGSRLLSATIT